MTRIFGSAIPRLRGALAPFFLLALFLPSLAAAAQLYVDPQFGVSKTSNVQYASNPIKAGSLPLTMDIYQPTGAGVPAQKPVIILMHGGYFVDGTKTDSNMVDFANAFASRGWVAASINYRLVANLPPPPGTPLVPYLDRLPAWLPSTLTSLGVTLDQYEATIAAAVKDEGDAVNYMASNAGTYGINPNWLSAGGYSAGAVSSLALGAGVVNGAPTPDLKTIFSLAGALFGWENVIDASMPNTFLIHGTLDDVVPYSEYPFMKAALDGAGVPNQSLVVPGANHTSPLLGQAIVNNANTFFSFMAAPYMVPEPSSVVLLGLGGIMIAVLARRRRRHD